MSALHFASYELIKQAAEAILTHPPIALTSCYGALSGATAMTSMNRFDKILSLNRAFTLLLYLMFFKLIFNSYEKS